MPSRPRLLAIDTSTERLVAAVAGGEAEPIVLDEEGGARASARLIPALQELLRQAGLALSDLDAIAFGRGPGAFTGLRTACAVAQGLALGAAKPVLPIDSLLIVAEDARLQAAGMAAAAAPAFEVAVAMDARMGEAYAARYRHAAAAGGGEGRWQVVQAPALWSVDALARDWGQHPPANRAGSGLSAFAGRLPASGPAFETGRLRAQALHALARAAWNGGEAVDAALALPLYLRDKVALTTAEREALRAAS